MKGFPSCVYEGRHRQEQFDVHFTARVSKNADKRKLCIIIITINTICHHSNVLVGILLIFFHIRMKKFSNSNTHRHTNLDITTSREQIVGTEHLSATAASQSQLSWRCWLLL